MPPNCREILQNLSASIDDSSESSYTRERKPEKILFVVITSNRGLCGAFNSNIIKAVVTLIQTDYAVQLARAMSA